MRAASQCKNFVRSLLKSQKSKSSGVVLVGTISLLVNACSYETGYLYQKQPFNQQAEIDPEEVSQIEPDKPIPPPPGPPGVPARPDPALGPDARPPAPGTDTIPGPPRPPAPPPMPPSPPDHDTRPPAPGTDPFPRPPGPPPLPPAPPPTPGPDVDPVAPTPLCDDFSLEQRVIDSTEDMDLGAIVDDDCLDLNLRFPSGSRETISGATRFRPLALYFVLDTTGSMSGNIAAVRNGILGFVDRLEADGFDVQLGLTTFHDTVLFVDEPTRDVAAFRTRVGALVGTGGGDAHEAALIAMQRTYQKMATLGDDVLKAALVVTDEVGHNGDDTDGIGRNCSIRPLVDYLNSFSEEQQQLLKLYYSVDTGSPCSSRGGDDDSWSTASMQWEAVLGTALPTVERSLRGGALDYPPSSTTIIDDFADLLVETTPDIRKVCLTREARLTIGTGISAIQRDWETPSFADVRAAFDRGERISDWVPLLFDDIDSHRGQTGEVTLARCCYLEEDLDSASFASCTDERTQRVRFTLAP